MGNLSSSEPTLASTDKLIHFSGYFSSGSSFSIGLRPLYWAPAILLLIGGGVALEYLQTFVGRNSLSLKTCVCQCAGHFRRFFCRHGWKKNIPCFRDEILNIAAHTQTVLLKKGDIIFNQEEPSDYVYVMDPPRSSRDPTHRREQRHTLGSRQSRRCLW